jgi:hypothetical protein
MMQRISLAAAASTMLLAAVLLGHAARTAEPLAPPALLRDQLWTSGPDLALTLTQAPPECRALPKDDAERLSLAIGRVLFRSPGILAGPAARLGLSCNACHPNGHTNAAFDLPELTDRPGAADVTAEWASAVRGDGIMNPRPIPDLTDVGTRKTLGHQKERSLARFVDKVVVEEFQGHTLPAPAMTGLLSYLRALKTQACPAGVNSAALTLDGAAQEVRDALAAAVKSDAPTAMLLLLGAQEAMGRIDERLPPSRFGEERRAIAQLAHEVGVWRARAQPQAQFAAAARGWMARFDGLMTALAAKESDTYFNATALRAALASP